MKFADLHTHTYFSDGKLSPEELIDKALGRGLTTISISDHDTLGAYDYLQSNSITPKIDLITGIELSGYEGTSEFHILGYNFDLNNNNLREHTINMKKSRLIRAEKILLKLSSLGIKLEMDQLVTRVAEAAIGRPHIAELMFDKGYVTNLKDAYLHYIGDGCPAYVQKMYFSVRNAIELINKSGGVAVLAHPANSTDQSTLYRFIKYGLDGIEVIHPSHTPYLQKYYHSIASQYWLLETGGSDFHGIAEYEESNFGKFVVPSSVVDSIRFRAKSHL
ncbi:MAG: PHP domain-containing protein [Candidatus Kapabacteria bacterium]|nr:PHP domain-containing protein [Candidatus Kapabacteria bacterium]